MSEADMREIMKCLGSIEAKVESWGKATSNANAKITIALIGVIAAQIGVKILGSDPLLDVSTALALIAMSLIAGMFFLVARVTKNGRQLTRTGYWLLVFMALSGVTQLGAYLRDIGLLESRPVYIVRIVQNIALIVFCWSCLTETRLLRRKKEESKEASYGMGDRGR